MRNLFGLLLSLFSATASANELESLTVCYDNAENAYRGASERLVSLYETVAIDRFDFEKARTDILRLRDQRLRQCAELENERLKVQLQLMNSASRSPASIKQNHFLPSGYQEIQSSYEAVE